MNSREKGKRGERMWRDELRANGYNARRGQQFSGSPDSPDVVCESLPWAHFEVKAVERLNIEDAMAQARRGAGAKVPFVAHKRNFCGWLVTMDADAFFRLLRGDLPQAANAEILKAEPPKPESGAQGLRSPTPENEKGGRSATRPTTEISAAACAVATNENNKGT